MKGKLYLTSSISKVAEHVSDDIAHKKGEELLFVDTAADPEREQGNDEWFIRDRNSLINVGFDVEDYTLKGKDEQEVKEKVENYNFIYVSGGDTVYLLEHSNNCNFGEIITEEIMNKGKTYIGSSAGSIIAGPRLPKYLYDEDNIHKYDNNAAYNIVNFITVPHWGSEDFREEYLERRLEIAYHKEQLPLILLTNKQYIKVENNRSKILNV